MIEPIKFTAGDRVQTNYGDEGAEEGFKGTVVEVEKMQPSEGCVFVHWDDSHEVCDHGTETLSLLVGGDGL